MKTTLYIHNLKCSHCETIIIEKLSKLKHISHVFIKRQYATVTFEHETAKDIDLVKTTLSKMGYPPFGEKNNLIKKTKSYLSCAINQNKK